MSCTRGNEGGEVETLRPLPPHPAAATFSPHAGRRGGCRARSLPRQSGEDGLRWCPLSLRSALKVAAAG
ncbi:hypothetical protein FB008_10268 [Sinorhizobium medicae]|nr:hypothetical protein FB006_107220 [Sinorhizobium medicae]TWA55501.1 hypothetical protein FB008_10268 [Sinorhizobium medicae]